MNTAIAGLYIVRASEKDASQLAPVARQSFVESHGRSATHEDINAYVSGTYNKPALEADLLSPENFYHLAFYNGRLAGYSKFILNTKPANSGENKLGKIDRLYLLQSFYGLGIGSALLDNILSLLKMNDQKGAWLYVWKENLRAVNFYLEKGFVITGSYEFRISASHSNPNHQMTLIL